MRIVPFLLLLLGLLLSACKAQEAAPEFSRPLPPGASALRQVTDPARLPYLRHAYAPGDTDLMLALDRSIAWFEAPSSRRAFPIEGVTHEQARASVHAFRDLLANASSAQGFVQQLLEQFDVYESVGWDGQGTVLYTGYYSPIFSASHVRTSEYRYPLYRRPHDLVTDPATGQTLGRRVNGRLTPYPARQEIEQTQMLRGQELVWLRSKLDTFIVQVQGNAKLLMSDDSILHIGYAGTNGREYTSIGYALVRDGKIPQERLNLATIRRYFQHRPGELDHYLNQNERYVFFQPYDGENWPAGSLGVQVTPMRTLATDKSVFPRGGVVLVDTQVPTMGEGRRPFTQVMVDQDTGGAIRAPGRGDIYMGVGAGAEQIAGRQYHTGRLYYFFLKPEQVAQWRR